MRVLWISWKSGLYKQNIINGTGGWVGALQEELLRQTNIQLGICFPHPEDNKLVEDGNVTYLPYKFGPGSTFKEKIWYHLTYNEKKEEKYVKENIIEAISLFKPDLIHVWGLEQLHSAVLPFISQPCLVHIQGLLSLYNYIYCPPSFSEIDIKKSEPFYKTLLNLGGYFIYKEAISRAKRELRFAPYVKNWIGRTDWDKEAAILLSPNSNYFHCDEIMRSDFLDKQWHYKYKDKICIQSNISNDWYKGIDVILKTAVLMNTQNISFQWDVFGIEKKSSILNYMVKKFRLNLDCLHINFHGKVTGSQICENLLNTDVYVHPSYIENSSNAIAEAMMLGVPTIAQYVGGNPSMLKNDSGILVSPNEPYALLSAIIKMKDRNIAEGYSERAKLIAGRRQNNKNIVLTLIEIYNTIIDKANDN